MNKTDWQNATCDGCGLPFTTEQEWNDRHTPEDESYHDECCPSCDYDALRKTFFIRDNSDVIWYYDFGVERLVAKGDRTYNGGYRGPLGYCIQQLIEDGYLADDEEDEEEDE